MFFRSLVSISVLLITAQTAQAQSGWSLFQRTSLNTFNVYISKNAVRADEVKTKFSIIAKAPKWDVVTFRNDHKLIHKSTLKKFIQTGISPMNERTLIKPVGKKAKIKIKEISNLKYFEYTVPFRNPRRFSNGHMVSFDGFMTDFKNVKTIHSTNYKLMVSPVISTHSDIATVLSSLFVVPIGKGVPIRFTINYDNGFKHVPLITQKIRKVNLSDKIFQIPRNYKTVASIQNVTTGHASSSLGNMIDGLGIGENLGKQKGKNK